ncbi:serine-threonine protein kinase [Streptomyces sp. AN091965]|uniref:serine-threonine protein kinase n=1 Tax=Streptomyces sp. AN091965 TaxID=2927803 RepID=UPI001F61FC61|nr:serine-threonine protein kinase [Streptomyces sp. AN091965]MCI3929595.1 serine-threonine protein kinase [Streptomyces sp. AN091965]
MPQIWPAPACGGTMVDVEPYWELTFDADGDVDAAQRDRLLSGAKERRITDLLVFAHGWNNDQRRARALYQRFFTPFASLTGPDVRLGYVGVLWPSMRFPDERIPDFEPSVAAGAPGVPGVPGAAAVPPTLDEPTRRLLAQVFPGPAQAARLDRLARLLEERSEVRSRLDEFARHVRDLVAVHETSPAHEFADDTGAGEPAMLTDDAVEVCEVLTAALESAGCPELLGGLRKRLWHGARELLRQGSYYAMKRRAGAVGQVGLGPALGLLAARVPRLRVHLIGHSFGARLVSYGLRGMPAGAGCVKSATLLQGAFSHYAFSERLPHDHARGGALHGVQQRVDGPLVACYSSHDDALGRIYPLASKLAGDSASFLGLWERWGAVGFDGIHATDGARRVRLGAALPRRGCVSVDAAAVVRRGGPPSGAHSDICHEELARVVCAAGRIGVV